MVEERQSQLTVASRVTFETKMEMEMDANDVTTSRRDMSLIQDASIKNHYHESDFHNQAASDIAVLHEAYRGLSRIDTHNNTFDGCDFYVTFDTTWLTRCREKLFGAPDRRLRSESSSRSPGLARWKAEILLLFAWGVHCLLIWTLSRTEGASG